MQKNISLKRREVDYGQPKKLPSLERRGVRRQPDGAVLILIYAARASLTMPEKAAGSERAISDKTLRFKPIPFLLRAFINLE